LCLPREEDDCDGNEWPILMYHFAPCCVPQLSSREPTCAGLSASTTLMPRLCRHFWPGASSAAQAVPRRTDSRNGKSNRHTLLSRYAVPCHNWLPPWPGNLCIRHGSALSTYTVACHHCNVPVVSLPDILWSVSEHNPLCHSCINLLAR
jgi:hypothetical protein